MDAAELENLDVLADLSDADRATVADAAIRRVFPAGREIVRRGEVSDGFFVILEGTARVVRGDDVVNTLGPGAFFGEWASLVAGPGYALSRNASVVADSDVALAVLTSDRFTEFYSTLPGLRDRVDAAMKQRDP
jgi:CRP-like cAMP-binding protein